MRGGMLPQLNDDVNRMIGEYVSDMYPTHAHHMENLSKYSKVNRYGNAVFSSALFEGKESAEDLAAYLAKRREPWKSFTLLCIHPRLSDEFLLKIAMKLWKTEPFAFSLPDLHRIPIMKRQKTMGFLMKRGLLQSYTLDRFVADALAAGDTESVDFFLSIGLSEKLGSIHAALDTLPDNSLRWLCAHANLWFVENFLAHSARWVVSAEMVRKLAESGCDITDLHRNARWPDIKEWVKVDPTLTQREHAAGRVASLANTTSTRRDDLIRDLQELTYWVNHDVEFNQDAQNNALAYLARVNFWRARSGTRQIHVDMADLLINLLHASGAPVPQQLVQKVADAVEDNQLTPSSSESEWTGSDDSDED